MIGPKKKKNRQKWLKQRYALLLRNEDNLQDTTPFRFTGLQFLLISVIVLILFMAIISYLSLQIFMYWERNHSERGQWTRAMVHLATVTDSLDHELHKQSIYMKSISAVLDNDTAYLSRTPMLNAIYTPAPTAPTSQKGEQTPLINASTARAYQSLQSMPIEYSPTAPSTHDLVKSLNFYSPITGYVSDRFSIKKRHYGIDLVAPLGTPIHSIADGTIIFSSWTQDGGYVVAVQHASNLLSIYKHNQRLLHDVGQYVRGGDPIAILGNTGELTSGPHLHLELWYKGKAVNPQTMVSFQ